MYVGHASRRHYFSIGITAYFYVAFINGSEGIFKCSAWQKRPFPEKICLAAKLE